MSDRYETDDQRIYLPGKTSGTVWGFLRTRSSTGTNQDSDDPLSPHPYSLTLTEQFTPLTSVRRCSTKALSSYDAGAFSGPTFPNGDLGPADDLQLYGRLQEKYDKGDFNASIFVGELGETVDMLAGRTKQLYLLARNARKGNFRDAYEQLKKMGVKAPKPARHYRNGMGPQDGFRISDQWLELQYGWKPLLGDIYSLSDKIAKHDQPRRYRLVARVKKPAFYRSNLPSIFTTENRSFVAKQVIAYVEEDIPSWPQNLGLLDPELVAWELVPFSFVVDWFMPIGNWLQARSFASRAKGTFVFTTMRRYHCRYTGTLPQCAPGATYYRTLDSYGYLRRVIMNRTVTTSLPQVPLPSFGNGIMKGNRLANGLALLTSIFAGRK